MRFYNDSLDNKTITEEMLSFVPLCVHENVQECLILGNGELPKDAKNLAKNTEKEKSFTSKKFDVIISFSDKDELQELFRILKKDGILCKKLGIDAKTQLLALGEYYRIVMPYHNMEMVFASNKYHPTADLILDKSDFLEENEYYNSDIHMASFAVYEKAKKALRGVAKN